MLPPKLTAYPNLSAYQVVDWRVAAKETNAAALKPFPRTTAGGASF
jgi:hypothetical protein